MWLRVIFSRESALHEILHALLNHIYSDDLQSDRALATYTSLIQTILCRRILPQESTDLLSHTLS